LCLSFFSIFSCPFFMPSCRGGGPFCSSPRCAATDRSTDSLLSLTRARIHEGSILIFTFPLADLVRLCSPDSAWGQAVVSFLGELLFSPHPVLIFLLLSLWLGS
jgi:hypothetical protein